MSADPATVDRAAALLERHAGLQFDATSRDRLARAIDALAAVAGRSAAEHVAALTPGAPDLDELRDAVTLQETSWFRDPAWWRLLEEDLLPAAAAQARAAGRSLVLWSAGCANGQEPYSLAIACEEAGIGDYRIVASDLSRAACARTAAGVYAERELRGLSAARGERWLARTADGFVVDPRLRAAVTTSALNLARDAPPIADGTCGVVLCRYVLIYLAPEASAAALATIERALAPDGHLVIGAAESLWHLSDRFAVVAHQGAFSYRARGRDVDDGVAAPPLAPPARRPSARPARAAPSAAPPPSVRPRTTGARREAAAPASPGSSDPAVLLADGERALRDGDLEQAAACFRGAAYLDPGNALAHLQLGLVLERAEDPGAQRAFRAAWSALRDIDRGSLEKSLGGYRAEELVHLVAAKLGESA